ncbi:MAG TPA: hypothetical protein PLG47_03520, partial [Candidatus Dojkabacteria bacterium]|nr:hypothetical protein [Candidatus Dojkabacteria bacterium]
KVVTIDEKVLVYHHNKTKKKEPEKEYGRAFMDTGVQTSRITETFANRVGFLSTTQYFNSLNVPKKFSSIKEAQEYIDNHLKALTLEENIKRVAKIVDGEDVKVRPVIEIKVKISGEIKDIEVVIIENSDYHLIIGREALKGYLIDTSKTFKN